MTLLLRSGSSAVSVTRLALVAMLLATVTGCSVAERRTTDTSTVHRRTGGILRFAFASGPVTLDPANMVQLTEAATMRPVMSGLMRLNARGEVVPDLARSLKTSDNGLTVTIKLRKGLRWSDGSRLTSHDVVRSWQRLIGGTYQTIGGTYYYNDLFKGSQKIVDGVADPKTLGVTAADDTTVIVKLRRPTAYFDQLLAQPGLWPVPKSAQAGDNPDWWKKQPYVSSGAFTLRSPAADRERKIRLVRNRYYWNADRVDLDAIEIVIVRELNAALAPLRAGTLHGASDFADATGIKRLTGTPGFSLEPAPSTGSLVLRSNRPLLRDRRVRKAISMAIDRAYVAGQPGTGAAAPTRRMTPPMLDNADILRDVPGSDSDKPGEPDVAGAHALLAQAGLKPGSHLVMLAVFANNTTREDAVAQGIERAGLPVEVRPAPAPQKWVEMVGAKDVDFDAYFVQTNSVYPDANSMFSQWRCSVHYCDRAFDRTLDRANSTNDERRRTELLRQAESILTGPNSQYAVIPLYHASEPIMYRPEVTGERSTSLAYLYLDRLGLKNGGRP